MRNTKQNKENITMFPAACIGALIALAMTAIIASLIAVFILNEYINIAGITMVAVIIQGISIFIGSFAAGKIVCDKKLPTCIITAGVYYLILLSTALLFFDGISESVFIGLVTGAIACSAAVYLCTKEKRGTVRRRRIRRSR